ncbi:fibronectin type III domain-containing protein [Streptosporangium lutulentum]
MTQTLPVGTVAAGAYGTGWVCAAPSGRSVTCTNSNGPFPAGATLAPITVVGIVTATGVTPALVQSTTVATSSASDANPAYSSSTTVGTLPATPSGISLSSTSGTIARQHRDRERDEHLQRDRDRDRLHRPAAGRHPGRPAAVSSGVTTGCFVNNGNGTLTIPSMPARSTSGLTNVTVVTVGLAAAAAYTYLAAPAAPTAPTAVAGVTSATVTWTAPASNGSAITGYVVTPTRNGVAQTPVSFDASATSRTLTGLTASASYTFTVAAVNAIGTGSPSPASNAVVPYDVPGGRPSPRPPPGPPPRP